MEDSMSDVVLEVKDLRTWFTGKGGVIPAVDGLSFSLCKREVLGMVGESGCGKTVANLSLLKLIPEHSGKIMPSSSIKLLGRELTELSEQEMSNIRGKDIAMIFQDPMTSLNPVVTVEKQIVETILRHQKVTRAEARRMAVVLLERVGIPDAKRRLKDFPHQMSGGMRQRVTIAIALSCNPSVLIADEPTTALDVTIQAQIIDLLMELKETIDTSIILITHDLGVVADMADNILVMYAGNMMEYASADAIFQEPLHPYTQGLLASIPRFDMIVKRLYSIEGTVPALKEGMHGCKFYGRCPVAFELCSRKLPPFFIAKGIHQVRCWKYGGVLDDEKRGEGIR
jgi:peptide/nickel transport system ATP-binding protein/oligopeptide transport system ATP-binding protein